MFKKFLTKNEEKIQRMGVGPHHSKQAQVEVNGWKVGETNLL
jgi:hypothetical protein